MLCSIAESNYRMKIKMMDLLRRHRRNEITRMLIAGIAFSCIAAEFGMQGNECYGQAQANNTSKEGVCKSSIPRDVVLYRRKQLQNENQNDGPSSSP